MTIELVGYSTCARKLVVANHAPATLILLYSRLTGLTMVFTFHYSRSHSNLAPSASDPYLLPLPNDGPDILASRANPHVSHRSSTISAIILKAVKYESRQGSIPTGLGQDYSENGVVFYQLSLLTKELALLECLYADVQNEYAAQLCPPDTFSRSRFAKTPAKIASDFIVPNGYIDRIDEDSLRTATAEEQLDAGLAMPHEDPFTINFEWLDSETHDALAGAYPTTEFHENLDLLRNKIEDKIASGFPTMETLYVDFNDSKKATRTHSIFIGFA